MAKRPAASDNLNWPQNRSITSPESGAVQVVYQVAMSAVSPSTLASRGRTRAPIKSAQDGRPDDGAATDGPHVGTVLEPSIGV